MTSRKKLGILQCGAPSPPLASFGSSGTMLRDRFAPTHDVQLFDVRDGELPDLNTCDAFMVTGSPAGIYEGHSWIPPLLDFLRAAKDRVPLVGVCFGHQALARAFGGSVIKSPKGWGIGVHEYEVLHRPAWMDAVSRIRGPAMHQDQVVGLPPGTRVLAGSYFTPYAVLDYGGAISFQFHPEIRPDFGIASIEDKRGELGACADPAIASYASPNDCDRVTTWINRFLEAPLPRAH